MVNTDTKENDLLRARLRALFSEFGIETSENQTFLLLEHLRLLFETNKTLNLTRITSHQDALVKHLLDSALFSLVYTKHLNHLTPPTFIDIGTGGGFPGIPFAILQSSAQGLLVDSVSKKIVAVNNFIYKLKLNDRLSTSDLRCEDIARSLNCHYNLVLARAVASLPILLEYASPLLPIGGYAIFSKASPSKEELDDAQFVSQLVGLSLITCEEFFLPSDAGIRQLYLYQKTSEASISLPRRNGAATKKPLSLR